MDTQIADEIWQPCIVVFLFYNGSEEEGRTNFKEFLDLSEFARC